MVTSSSTLRYEAQQTLEGQWLPAVGIYLVMCILVFVGTLVIPILKLFSGFISAIFLGAFATMLLNLRRTRKQLYINDIFTFFGQARLFGTVLLAELYITLWSLLLVVPGIIKYYSYAMTVYILNDNPDLSYNAAIDKSREMMRGQKLDLFCLDLSFIGWYILALLSFGIGFLWLGPYITASHVAFYEHLKNSAAQNPFTARPNGPKSGNPNSQQPLRPEQPEQPQQPQQPEQPQPQPANPRPAPVTPPVIVLPYKGKTDAQKPNQPLQPPHEDPEKPFDPKNEGNYDRTKY
ncbi:MAG: DUF975 family protein [Bacteroidales bacterium]|nr:DUF975 family protein [Bacteroidales bacterium]